MKEVSTSSFSNEFEQLYIRLRQKEGRIYRDEELLNLPSIDELHPTYDEWKIREISFKKLLNHIKQRPGNINILEVGCGNGWLSAQLAKIAGAKVIGIDINHTELEQAKRIFLQYSNLNFIEADLRDGILDGMRFDFIIFAASIQYFRSLKEILGTALMHLKATGEIHILDSHFYSQEEIEAARQRTKDYYASAGFSELTKFYHHHSMEELNLYKYSVLYDPGSWKRKLLAGKNPFHWIVLKKQ